MMAPCSTSFLRMRPNVLSLAAYPWWRSRMASLALPHIGKSARASRTAAASSGDHSGRRTRRGQAALAVKRLPAVEGGPRHADGIGRVGGARTVVAGATPGRLPV